MSRADSVRQTAKARTVARILLASDRAVEPVVSQARTAGRAFRVWQIQRQLDSDVDIESLSKTEQSSLGRYLAKNGEEGAQVVADGGENAIAVIQRFDNVDDDTVDRLAKLRKSGELETSDLNRLENALEAGKIDADDLRRISKLYDSENEQYFIGSDAEVEDVLRVRDKGGNIEQTEGVIVRDGDVRWIQRGDYNTGWAKIQRKHLFGVLDETDDIVTFFEIGQRVRLREQTVNMDNRRSVTETKALTMKVLKNGEQPLSNKDPARWEWSPSGSDVRVRTIIDDNGQVVTSYRVDDSSPRYTKSNGWENK